MANDTNVANDTNTTLTIRDIDEAHSYVVADTGIYKYDNITRRYVEYYHFSANETLSADAIVKISSNNGNVLLYYTRPVAS